MYNAAPSSKINVMAWNCQSVYPKKIELVHHLLNNNIDIALLNETWLQNHHTLHLPSYTIYRADRLNGAHGGVAIVIKSNIKHTVINNIHTQIIEQIGIKISTANGEITLFSCYFPGSNNLNKLNQFKADIVKLTTFTQHSYFLIGDFNAKHNLWNNTRANAAGKILYDINTRRNFVIHHPPTPTYYPTQARYTHPSTIDIAITNNVHPISDITSTPALSSDHNPIEFSILSNKTVSVQKESLRYDLADWDKFKKNVSVHTHLLNEPSNPTEIDDCITLFSEIIHENINACIPKTKHKTNTLVIPIALKHKITYRNCIRRSWQRTQDPHTKQHLRHLNRQIHKECLDVKNNQFSNNITKLNTEPNKLWRFTKLLKNKKTVMPPIRDVNTNTFLNSDADKVNAIAEQFHKNHHITLDWNSSHIESQVRSTIQNIQNTQLNKHINMPYYTKPKEIMSIIKTFKAKKSPGTDDINNTILKQLPRRAIVTLNMIFNSCIHNSYFPQSWKIAKVIAIPKPNKDHSIPSNYRPISLLSATSKILEKIILLRINTHIEDKNILPVTQFGFRQHHSTIHQLSRVVNHIKLAKASKESTGLLTLDIEKAFDSIWHDGLVHKMFKLDFPPTLIKMTHSFLRNRMFFVQHSKVKSLTHEIPAGVPQGSCLSPTLYNIYTADFPIHTSCCIAQFADDTALYTSSICPKEITHRLAHSFNTVNNYFKTWKIKINEQKSQAIFITRRRAARYLPQNDIQTSNGSIAWTQEIKYLGLIIDKKLTFDKHCQHTNQKAQILIKIMYPLINRKSKLNTKNKLIIYTTIVRPLILYACEVWGTCADRNKQPLQITQNKILKMLLKLPYYYNTDRLHSNANITTLETYILNSIQKFKESCSTSPHPHIQSINID